MLTKQCSSLWEEVFEEVLIVIVFACILVSVILADEMLRFLISVTRCSKLVKTTRNELGTVPKTSRKLKQTMLDLYPVHFLHRSYHPGPDLFAGLLAGFGFAHHLFPFLLYLAPPPLLEAISRTRGGG